MLGGMPCLWEQMPGPLTLAAAERERDHADVLVAEPGDVRKAGAERLLLAPERVGQRHEQARHAGARDAGPGGQERARALLLGQQMCEQPREQEGERPGRGLDGHGQQRQTAACAPEREGPSPIARDGSGARAGRRQREWRCHPERVVDVAVRRDRGAGGVQHRRARSRAAPPRHLREGAGRDGQRGTPEDGGRPHGAHASEIEQRREQKKGAGRLDLRRLHVRQRAVREEPRVVRDARHVRIAKRGVNDAVPLPKGVSGEG